MKEKFEDYGFTDRTAAVVAQADAITQEYMAQGYDLSVRQLYYQFVSRNIFENSVKNYDLLQTVVSKARLAGLIDWDAIKDRGRPTHQRDTYPSLKTYLQALNEHFRLDKWEEQRHYVEVMVEKQALEGVLLPVCEKYEVAFTATKGFTSQTSAYERAKYLQSMRDVKGKEVHVLYLGDHDPSGMDMSRDILERLEKMSDGPVDVQRVALNYDQVQRHQLPENVAKKADSRWAKYVEQYGMSSWELDALSPNTLATLIESAIKQFLDMPKWRAAEARQLKAQDELQDIITSLT